jgi:hypothetical protein
VRLCVCATDGPPPWSAFGMPHSPRQHPTAAATAVAHHHVSPSAGGGGSSWQSAGGPGPMRQGSSDVERLLGWGRGLPAVSAVSCWILAKLCTWLPLCLQHQLNSLQQGGKTRYG